jgi:hypothetical protein
MPGIYRVVLSLLLLVLCSAAAQAQVKTVTIMPASAEGEVGQQLKLAASGLDVSGKVIEQKAMLWAARSRSLRPVKSRCWPSSAANSGARRSV